MHACVAPTTMVSLKWNGTFSHSFCAVPHPPHPCVPLSACLPPFKKCTFFVNGRGHSSGHLSRCVADPYPFFCVVPEAHAAALLIVGRVGELLRLCTGLISSPFRPLSALSLPVSEALDACVGGLLQLRDRFWRSGPCTGRPVRGVGVAVREGERGRDQVLIGPPACVPGAPALMAVTVVLECRLPSSCHSAGFHTQSNERIRKANPPPVMAEVVVV